MKPSFKTTTLIAAIGMSIYTIYIVIHYAIHILYYSPYHFDLVQDICQRIGMDTVLIAMLIAGLALLQYRPLSHTSKSFRIYTLVLASLLLLTALICSIPILGVYINGARYFYADVEWRIIFLIMGIVWLIMLSRQEASERPSIPFRFIICCGIIVLCIPMLLEIISGISLLCSGKILFLHSSCIFSWVRHFVPTIILCWYSIEFYLQSIMKQKR